MRNLIPPRRLTAPLAVTVALLAGLLTLTLRYG